MKNFFKKSHSNKGFSLVELIVVIAIMAIIAGVSIPVYNLYIDKAKKGNDVALVGEVLNAIDIAINSGTIKPDDSYKLTMGTLPIGFIIINENGAQIISSDISISYDDAVNNPCVFETVDVKKITASSVTGSCGMFSTKNGIVYTITDETIKYCKTHGAEPTQLEQDEKYSTKFGCTNSGLFLHIHHEWGSTEDTTLTAGTLVANSSVKLVSSTDSTKCEAAYAALNGEISGGDVSSVTEGPIYDALVAAFGSLDNIKLSYDGWSSEGDQSYATIYPYSGNLLGDLAGLADKLVAITVSSVSIAGLEKDYETTEDLISTVAANFEEKYAGKYTNWEKSWDKAATTGFDQHGFGFSYNSNGTGDGRENYLSLIRLYNESLAGYLQANGITDNTIIDAVKTFGEAHPVISTLASGQKLPIAVNLKTATGSTTKNVGAISYTVNGALENITSDQKEKALDLIKKYSNSEASHANAKAVYDFMMSIAATSDEAKEFVGTDNSVSDFNEYYNQYVGKVSNFFAEAQTYVGNGIMIVVTVEDGVVKSNVSPYTANPRNNE